MRMVTTLPSSLLLHKSYGHQQQALSPPPPPILLLILTYHNEITRRVGIGLDLVKGKQIPSINKVVPEVDEEIEELMPDDTYDSEEDDIPMEEGRASSGKMKPLGVEMLKEAIEIRRREEEGHPHTYFLPFPSSGQQGHLVIYATVNPVEWQ